jgi:hypothetical protein
MWRKCGIFRQLLRNAVNSCGFPEGLCNTGGIADACGSHCKYLKLPNPPAIQPVISRIIGRHFLQPPENCGILWQGLQHAGMSRILRLLLENLSNDTAISSDFRNTQRICTIY